MRIRVYGGRVRVRVCGSRVGVCGVGLGLGPGSVVVGSVVLGPVVVESESVVLVHAA